MYYDRAKLFNYFSSCENIILIISNYIIPSESQLLTTLSENSGVSVVWDINAKPFIEEKKLQLVWNSTKMPSTEIFILSRKNDTLSSILEEVQKEMQTYLG